MKDISWLNSPCTDPIGRVFAAEGRIWRAIFPGLEEQARRIIRDPTVCTLMDDGLVARMQISDRKVSGHGMVVEVEKAPFDVPCDRFTRSTLREATLRWLEIYRRLLPAGLVLSDAHYGNYMLYGANEPRWVDLGSIRPANAVTEEQPFQSFTRFWSGMLAPLILLEAQPSHTRIARLAIADQPYQGPLTTAHESPLTVDSLVDPQYAQVAGKVRLLAAPDALSYLTRFVEHRAHLATLAPRRTMDIANDLVRHIGDLLTTARVASIICLGADSFLGMRGAFGKWQILVIDEGEDNLDTLDQDLKRQNSYGTVTLYFAHVVNRIFMRSPPAADAVVAIDPLGRYAHSSHAATENLSVVLGALGRKMAIVIAKSGQQTAIERMLRDHYRSLSSIAFGSHAHGLTLLVGTR